MDATSRDVRPDTTGNRRFAGARQGAGDQEEESGELRSPRWDYCDPLTGNFLMVLGGTDSPDSDDHSCGTERIVRVGQSGVSGVLARLERELSVDSELGSATPDADS